MARHGSVVVCLVAALAWTGCDGEEVEGDTCGESLLAGSVIDETAAGFLDAESRAQVDATKSPVFTAPAAGTTLTKGSAPTFTWSSALARARGGVDSRRWAVRERPSKVERLWASVAGWVVPSAHAHGTPFNGDAYLLRVTDAEGGCFTAVTSELGFTPTSEAWGKLAAGTVEVELMSAVLRDDLVTEGPFRGESRSFTLE